jgi:hypothetical protein
MLGPNLQDESIWDRMDITMRRYKSEARAWQKRKNTIETKHTKFSKLASMSPNSSKNICSQVLLLERLAEDYNILD